MFNPTRRSRNIGKTQGGRVTDGRAVEKWSRFFGHNIWSKLSDLPEGQSGFMGLSENPSRGFYHPCTIDEYRTVLEKLPSDLTNGLRAIVLRRTSSQDHRLGIEARRRFSCVLINAFPVDNRMVWKESPSGASVRHYAPWCSRWVKGEGVWALEWSLDEIRRYYLYHLFLHELGHINQPSYHALRRRESFAENFALDWAHRLGVLPGPEGK